MSESILTVDEYVEMRKKELDSFKNWWKLMRQKEQEQFPLDMEVSMWGEQEFSFLNSSLAAELDS